MEEVSNKVRQEAAEIVINECKQWLLQIMAEEMDKISEEVRLIIDSRLKVEQIAAAFEEDSKRKTEKEAAGIVAKAKQRAESIIKETVANALGNTEKRG